jgi:hypothetical protein
MRDAYEGHHGGIVYGSPHGLFGLQLWDLSARVIGQEVVNELTGG